MDRVRDRVGDERVMRGSQGSGCLEPYGMGKCGNLRLLAFTEANWDARHTGIRLDDVSGKLW